jgi:predicted molibdopterin-dependent oxidoreductase YjgC
MLEAARAGKLRVLYAVGADPATDYPDAGAWAEARRGLGALVVHELFMTRTAASADVVLPALSFAEKAGTVCNIEGRIQRQDQAVLGPGMARSDALIFSQIAAQVGAVLGFSSWQDVFAEIGRIIPGWREDGRLPPPRRGPGPAQQPPRSTGGGPDAGAAVMDGALTLLTGSRLFDRGTMAVRCPGIRNQAGEPFVALHPDDARRLGLAGGAPCEVRSPRGSLRLTARIWSGLPPGQVYIPRGYDAAPVNRLLDERGPAAVTVRALLAAEAAG